MIARPLEEMADIIVLMLIFLITGGTMVAMAMMAEEVTDGYNREDHTKREEN